MSSLALVPGVASMVVHAMQEYCETQTFSNNTLQAFNVIADRALALGYYGKVPLITIEDLAFPRHPWLLKLLKG